MADASTDGLVELITYLRSFNDFKLQMVADAYEALQRSNAEKDEALAHVRAAAEGGDDPATALENVREIISKALSHSSETVNKPKPFVDPPHWEGP